MTATARRRLSPEERRNQLLDCACEIIVRKGLSSLTMELLATEAGVSNPLIYKYFDSRLQILQELLVREFDAFRSRVLEQVASVDDYRDVVRVYVETNFTQFAEGNIVSILMGQPDVRSVIKDGEKNNYGPLFVKELAREYKIDRKLATQIIVLASGASLSAAEHYSRAGGDRAALIEQTVAFIFGGIGALLGD